MKAVPLLFLVALATVPSVRSENWTQWGGPGRDFVVPDPGLAESWTAGMPREIWRRALGEGYSGIVSHGSTLFTMTRNGSEDVLIAIDAASGETQWRQTWPAPAKRFMDTEFGPGPHSTPLLAGGRVFAVGVTGRLAAFDQETGEELWHRELWAELGGTSLERGYAASPLAFEDLVILPVGGSNQGVMAFRQSDGSVAWQTGDFDIAYSSPILIEVDGQTQLIALLKTEILGLDPATGRVLWERFVTDERYVNTVTPLFTSGNLLFFDASDGGHLFRLEQKAGRTNIEPLWVDKVVGSQVGNVIRVGNHLYGTLGRSAASFMTGVDIASGKIVWRSREIGNTSLVVAGERVISLGGDGTLRLIRLSPAGLETISRAQVLEGRSWTVPTLVGATLYLRNRREMVAFDLGRSQ